ncbi:SusD/RagB family nutrient-binding outer membrane lipoprotein [Gelidibacter sp. F63206]|uniref:SusD/RagB family nutrient-binding outer membrane lipoprotein n=1 Tax=Gelidibacter sp. F63206 TaxID=2926425 RepID=UPI001FF66078|nr:SusD/RagB family nutrient-binding outer membrane lipoprotein [Gelidibacter sp. F63206]MCK0114957.1 SusD/RagB family nutrient-binding outer membrane lipoprotein [Gelidibacter sp. F63206]
MKNIINKSLFLVVILLCSSCMNEGLESLNEDTKNATVADPGGFFANATVSLAANINGLPYRATGPGITRLWVQHFTSVTYLEGVTYIPEYSWAELYRDVLNDLNESSNILAGTVASNSGEEKVIKNQQAMIEILKVYAYSNLVESYGNIPYSEALDFNNALPKYDDAKTVYLDLIDRLTSAINNIDSSVAGFGSSDLIYDGQAIKWIKFGNSLKLRMGMRIMDVLPQIGSEIILEASTLLIESNDDNATFRYLSEYPNTSPWYNFTVRQGLKYFVGTNTFIDKLNDLDDPRRSVFFTPTSDGTFKGAQYGVTQDYYSFSKQGQYFDEPELATIFIDFAQVEFLLAEAAERGVPGITNPENHYNNAIRASLEYYNIPNAEIQNYLAQPSVAYSTAQGTWKEKIGMQKWIALFNQGFEAWTEYRRLDYPELSAPVEAESDIVPLRFLYPISEHTQNGSSYEAAAAAIGGDNYSTKLFWDVE